MAGSTVKDFETFKAAADYSAKQFHIMKHTASVADGCTIAAAATDVLLGVLMDEPVSGAYGAVAMRGKGGKCPVKYGGTVAAGDMLTANGDGEAITTTTAGNKVLGIAAKDGVDNDIGEVWLGEGPSVVPA